MNYFSIFDWAEQAQLKEQLFLSPLIKWFGVWRIEGYKQNNYVNDAKIYSRLDFRVFRLLGAKKNKWLT